MASARSRNAARWTVALVALAAVVVLLVTSPGGAPPRSDGAPVGAAGDATSAPGAVAVPAPGVPAETATTASPAALAVPAAAGEQPWSAVPVAARLSDLGPLARHVYAGLQQARAAMDGCFQEAEREAQANPPGQPEEGGAAIVSLELESRPDELVIVGAPLQSIGTSSPRLVDCCEGVLRGFRIPAPGATPGRRYRLNHQLSP
ncbi:hypothetical protein [Anaeromyxobacter oryzae]|uniref:Uncharacterized protein n=1 Tax=Anaeromyxobacter oryzae TaxID=2918170 RepID=A0ABN6MN40_9BACT|nr:hypothetical protein [Anaeromyxobacter oryzae]BDG01020.1 hypothetical protein AMOR_00160 [Anaeromyxobacter oryzae]